MSYHNPYVVSTTYRESIHQGTEKPPGSGWVRLGRTTGVGEKSTFCLCPCVLFFFFFLLPSCFTFSLPSRGWGEVEGVDTRGCERIADNCRARWGGLKDQGEGCTGFG